MVTPPAAAGIFAFGASDYLIEDVSVENTRADGVHNTHGAHHSVIRRARVRNVGDDGVADDVAMGAGQATGGDMSDVGRRPPVPPQPVECLLDAVRHGAGHGDTASCQLQEQVDGFVVGVRSVLPRLDCNQQQ